MRLFGRRGSISQGVAATPGTGWSPEEQIRELRIGISVFRERVVRLERIITAAGIAKRQDAGWVVSRGKSPSVFIADVPGEG